MSQGLQTWGTEPRQSRPEDTQETRKGRTIYMKAGRTPTYKQSERKVKTFFIKEWVCDFVQADLSSCFCCSWRRVVHWVSWSSSWRWSEPFFFPLYLFVTFGCLVYSISSSLALALSKGIYASMCPCFHHFLLFSAKKKWDCASGDFYSFSPFLSIRDGVLPGFGRAGGKGHSGHGGLGEANQGADKPAGGCRGCRVWELQSFATLVVSPATARLGEGCCRRLVCKLRWHCTCIRNVCWYCEVANFEPKATELIFCKTLGIWFIPKNSQPALFDMRAYWHSYFCRTVTFYVADYVTVNVCYILVYSRVWDLP